MLRLVRSTETSIHATQHALAAHARLGGSPRVSGGWRERAAWAARLSLLEPRLRDRAVASLAALSDPTWALEGLASAAFAALSERRQGELLAALGGGRLDEARWSALEAIGLGAALDEPLAHALLGALMRGGSPELAALTASAAFRAAKREEQHDVLGVAEGLGELGADHAWCELLEARGDAWVERERLRDVLHAPRLEVWLYEPRGPAGRTIVLVGSPTAPLASFGQAVVGGRRRQRWAAVSSPDPLVASGWVGGEVHTHAYRRWLLSTTEVVRLVRWLTATFVERSQEATPPQRRFVAEVEQLLGALTAPRGACAERGTAYRGEPVDVARSQLDLDCEALLGRFMAA
jgi:hypothetical protein